VRQKGIIAVCKLCDWPYQRGAFSLQSLGRLAAPQQTQLATLIVSADATPHNAKKKFPQGTREPDSGFAELSRKSGLCFCRLRAKPQLKDYSEI
jgi:hypothetical protein